MAIYIGVNGQAKRVKSAYMGDTYGNAQVIYKEGIVPSGYIPVEYIFNDHNNQNTIDTGIIPTTYTRLIAKMSIGNNFPDPQPRDSYVDRDAPFRQFIGNSNISIDIRRYTNWSNGSIKYRYLKFICGAKTHQIDFNLNTIYTIDFNQNANKESYLDNTLIYTNTSTFTGTDSIKLFNSTSQKDTKLYSCAIYQSILTGTLTKNYIPCIRISDERVGLWETVNRTFETGSATSSSDYFSAGPLIITE